MRSDHLSKHIKTHMNKKVTAAGVSGAAAAGTAAVGIKVEAGAVPANDQHTIVTMETLSAESIARLTGCAVNMMQVDLQPVNGNNY